MAAWGWRRYPGGEWKWESSKSSARGAAGGKSQMPRLPLWGCNCGESSNFAWRKECRGCGNAAPRGGVGGSYRDALERGTAASRGVPKVIAVKVEKGAGGGTGAVVQRPKPVGPDELAKLNQTIASLAEGEDDEIIAALVAKRDRIKAARKAAVPPQDAWRTATANKAKWDAKVSKLETVTAELQTKLEKVRAELAAAQVEQANANVEQEAAAAAVATACCFVPAAGDYQAAVESRIAACKTLLASFEGYEVHSSAAATFSLLIEQYASEARTRAEEQQAAAIAAAKTDAAADTLPDSQASTVPAYFDLQANDDAMDGSSIYSSATGLEASRHLARLQHYHAAAAAAGYVGTDPAIAAVLAAAKAAGDINGAGEKRAGSPLTKESSDDASL